MTSKVIFIVVLIAIICGFTVFNTQNGGNNMVLAKGKDTKSLVVYFSRTGQQYSVGNISEGNTAIIGKMIAKETNADIFEIKVVKDEYPTNDYTALTQIAKEEGTYALYGGIGIDTPDNNILLEIYEDEEAYKKHVSSKGFLKYREEREPIMEKLIILEAEPIALEQKTSGIGTVIYLNKFDIVPEKLEEYKKLAVCEAKRAVKDEPCVMGMYFTSEKDNPNCIHIMTIFRFQSSFDKYFASKEYLKFKEKYEPMLESFHEVKCLPTKVIFNGRGHHF